VRAAVWLQVDAELFVETLQRIPVSADGVVAIYDAASATVARSRDNDIYAGRPAVRFPNMLYDGSDGTRQLYSPNFGRQTLYGFHHLDVAPGWHVTVFEPMDLASTILLGSLSSILPALTLVPLLLAMFVGVLWLIARASRQSHLELEHVLADVPVSIYIDDVTPDGGRLTLFRSVRAGRALGFSRAEVERFGNAYVRTFDETGAQRFAAFQTEAVVAGSASIELPVRHRDGSWRTLRYEERRLPAPRVGSVRVIGTVLDITDDVARESQQRQMERLAVLGEVAVGIAHQLSQPLTMLSMASQNALRSLRRDPPDIGRAEGKLAQIDAHVERMAGVLDHIRLFGRAGDAPRAPFDVADCVRKARLLVEGRFSRACVALVLEISSGLTPVEGHEVMLEQVLLSLLANAADAYEARPDIIDREVRIIVRPRGEELVIAVLDRAGGIPPEVIGRLFDPFFTTKEPGHGTGLGLSISLAIITEMGGRLSAYNEGTGACLEIALPVVTAGPPALVADGVA